MIKKFLIQDLSIDERILIDKYRSFSNDEQKALKKRIRKMILHKSNTHKKKSADNSKRIKTQ